MTVLNAFQAVRPKGVDVACVAMPNTGTCRPVDQLNADGGLIKQWPSAFEAARILGAGTGLTLRSAASGIYACCRSVRTNALGYRWRYALGVSER